MNSKHPKMKHHSQEAHHTTPLKRVLNSGAAIALLSLIGGFSLISPAHAAEQLVLTYGLLGRSITTSDLDNFVQTGQQTPTINFLLKQTRLKPEQAQQALSYKVKIRQTALDDVLYSLPGEYALFRIGKIIHTPARRSNGKALRSALLIASSSDQDLSILELIKHFPTETMYIDGANLAKSAKEVSKTINTLETEFQGPINIITDLFNGVICQCEQAPGPNSPINAN